MGIAEMIVFSIAMNLDISIISFSIGTRIRRKDEMPMIALILALLQSMVPIIGFFIGHFISTILGNKSKYLGSLILILTGEMVVREYLKYPYRKQSQKSLFLICLGAGIEDLLGGISLGTLKCKIIFFVLISLISSFLMNLIALMLGRSMRKHISFSADALAGVILIIIGIMSFFV